MADDPKRYDRYDAPREERKETALTIFVVVLLLLLYAYEHVWR